MTPKPTPPQPQRDPRKGGRPRKYQDGQQAPRATVRFNPAEYARVLEQADAAGLSVSDYCRQAALTGQIKAAIRPEIIPLLNEMRAIGNNLNQIVKKAQADGIRSIALKADGILTQLKTLLPE
jgi:hypothetical protein